MIQNLKMVLIEFCYENVWLVTEGYLSQLSSKFDLDSKALYKEFNEFNKSIDLFKDNFYKEEYK